MTVPGTAAQAEPETQQFKIIENKSAQPGERIVGTGAFNGVGTTIVHYFDINPEFTFQGSDTFVFDEGTLTVLFEGPSPISGSSPGAASGTRRAPPPSSRWSRGLASSRGATGSLASYDRTIVWFERGAEGCSLEEVSRYNAFIDITGTLELAQASWSWQGSG